MKQLISNRLVILLVALVFAVAAQATPIQFQANYYDLVLVANPFVGNNNTWTTASASAAASSYLGLQGHLVTIGSQAENDFLLTLIPGGPYADFEGAWLGGDASGWLVGPEAGQGFTFTNWGGIEPNNNGYAYMNIGTHPQIPTGTWADDSGVNGLPESPYDPVIGYFVEYEGATVPEPATFTLVALGVGVAIRRRR